MLDYFYSIESCIADMPLPITKSGNCFIFNSRNVDKIFWALENLSNEENQ